MRKMLLIAALLMTTSVAHAGDTFSFEINGQRVRIERPRNCTALSCINISAPGLFDSKSDDSSSTASSTPAPAPVAPAQTTQQIAPAPAPAAAPVQQASPAGSAQVGTVPPLPTQANAPQSTSTVTTLSAPSSDSSQTQQSVAAPATTPNQVVASAPVQQPVAQQPVPAPQAVGNSPVGVWMTEKNEGKVHVVNCGANLCGYAVNAKTGADGEQVLINMKPSDGGWQGRIHDTRGGGTYDSTIAMRGNDKMRVQGCAFGGMFCGGQTWTRVN